MVQRVYRQIRMVDSDATVTIAACLNSFDVNCEPQFVWEISPEILPRIDIAE